MDTQMAIGDTCSHVGLLTKCACSHFYARQLYRRYSRARIRLLAMGILSVCPSVCPGVIYNVLSVSIGLVD